MLKEWKLRTKYKKPEDLVFPNKRGWYSCHDNIIKRKFVPLLDVLRSKHQEHPEEHPPVPARLNWHALRHFAISCWIEADLKPKTVQTFAGHSSLQVTMDIYGHLFKSDNHKAAVDASAEDRLFFTSTLQPIGDQSNHRSTTQQDEQSVAVPPSMPLEDDALTINQ